MVGHILVGGLSEREGTVLDLLRQQGPMTLHELRAALNHRPTSSTVELYTTNLVEAGLVMRRRRARENAETTGQLPFEYIITDAGRAVF